jgi:hypothetical protein
MQIWSASVNSNAEMNADMLLTLIKISLLHNPLPQRLFNSCLHLKCCLLVKYDVNGYKL